MKGRVSKGLLALVGSAALAVSAFAGTADAARDPEIQSAVTARLQKAKELRGVEATVQDGIVTLRGTVDSFPAKAKAEKDARKAGHVAGVRDLIEIAGPAVPDSALQAKLARSLAYDRADWGNVFNVLTLAVNDGVVTVGGEVRTPVDKDSALDRVAQTKGVKGVVDNIKVAPLSNFDDQLRIRVARAIYGDSVLSRYGMDPQAPIRIVVDNGRIALYGVVDSQMDKTVAFLRASGVPGSFGAVQNNLQVGEDVAR